jgi:predicted ATPase
MVDLGLVGDSDLVGATVASAIGVSVSTAATASAIIAFLRQRRLLLILDSCEHVIDSVATLAEQIYLEASGIYILATTREALLVQGEHIYHLAALDAPPEGEALDAEPALAFPAVQLFVARVIAAESTFALSDGEAPVVAGMCRSLDGIPLAIELAAGRIGAYGIAETARLLNGSFPLAWRGRRTAPPRHQTLAATLDWSYALLLEPERSLLRRLAIFVGSFDMAAVRAIAVDEVLDEQMVLDSIAGLSAKSLVKVRSGARTSYRLLDTTRAYALQKLHARGEWSGVARLHAKHFRDQLSREKESMAGASPAAPTADRDIVGNVRAALEWCYGTDGDTEIGAEIASSAAVLFLRLSLLTECIRWMELALTTLDQRARGTALEMELQASVGVSLMFTNGNSERVVRALERSLVLAESVGKLDRQMQLQVCRIATCSPARPRQRTAPQSPI